MKIKITSVFLVVSCITALSDTRGQIKDINGFGLTYKDVVNLVPMGKKGVIIMSSSSCGPCKSLRKIMSEKTIDYLKVSIFYITVDKGSDGIHPWKEVDSISQKGWYEEAKSGLSMFPYVILVNANRKVVSRFPDILNNVFAFKQSEAYIKYYKFHPDEDWPTNYLWGYGVWDSENYKKFVKSGAYLEYYQYQRNEKGRMLPFKVWSDYFESKCESGWITGERIMDFIDNNEICVDYEEVAKKYYNPLK